MAWGQQRGSADWGSRAGEGSTALWWHGQQWWSCGICSGWCTAETKKCNRCGCKKSWAQIAAQQPAGSGSGDQALHARDAHLAAVSKGTEIRQQLVQLQGRALPLAANSPEPASKHVEDDAAHLEVGKVISQLKASLAALPPGDACADVRASITQRIEELRKQASRTKPVGAQLDACKAAISRARKRREEAEDLIALSQVVRAEAQEEEERLCQELAEIQARVPHEAHVQSGSVPMSSIDVMNQALAKVLSEMKIGGVAPLVVGEAELLMSKLSEGIERVAVLAKEAARSQCAMNPDFIAARPAASPHSGGPMEGSPAPGTSPSDEPPAKHRLLSKTAERDYVTRGFQVPCVQPPSA